MNIFSYLKNYYELLIIFLLGRILPEYIPHDNSILFINTGFIGDLLVSSILCENDFIFSKYEKIIFLIKKEYIDLFLDYKGKIKFYGIDYKRYKYSLIYKYWILKYLSNQRFYKVFNLTAARGILCEEITLLSGAKEKYCLNSNRKYLGQFIGTLIDKKYTQVIANNIFNEYEKHLELLRSLSEETKPDLLFYNKNTFDYKNKLESPDFDDSTKYVVIAPFSSERNRDWPKDKFKKLIQKLSKKIKVVLIGSKSQRCDLINLRAEINNVLVYAGNLQLNEIPSLLSRSELFIGIDSGMTHLALKLGTPLIGIIGGGMFNKFFPINVSLNTVFVYKELDCFNCTWKCIKSEKYCLTDVEVSEIIELANRMLKI